MSSSTVDNSKKLMGPDNGAAVRQSWILRLNSLKWMTPFRITLLGTMILGPISLAAGTPILTAAMMAYLLGISNYLINRQELELRRLRSYVSCDDGVFRKIEHSLRHHRRVYLVAAWVAGPIIMLAVNFNSPGVTQLRGGGQLSFYTIWGMSLASLFWITLIQVLAIFLTNAVSISNVGAMLGKIDLLDTGGLVPFARIGIRNLLIFVGGYALIPLMFFDGIQHTQAVLVSLAITGPIAVALLVLPIYRVRMRIGEEKDRELNRIQLAMHGNHEALSDSAISQDASTISFTGLILYRQMVQDISEWPLDFPVIIRMSLYIVIPLLTWFGAALAERLVDLVI
jgi:hypothetical protein